MFTIITLSFMVLRLIAHNFQVNNFLNKIFPQLLIFEIALFVKFIVMKITM